MQNMIAATLIGSCAVASLIFLDGAAAFVAAGAAIAAIYLLHRCGIESRTGR